VSSLFLPRLRLGASPSGRIIANKMPPPTDNDAVPEASPADLQLVWTKMHALQAHAEEGEATSIDIRSLQQLCSPGTDVKTAWTRTMMLQILSHISPGWMERADMDKVFEVAARFPMRVMQPGVEYDQPPFDVREFMKQIASR
jgi:hypothetical protein